LKIINDAIKFNTKIEFEYIPNQNPRGFAYGKRIAFPLRLFKLGGKYYMYAYFTSGASLSGDGAGFRLYFQKNMYNVKQFTYSTSPVKFKSQLDSQILKMIIKNEIE
jgi:hypothetical protein